MAHSNVSNSKQQVLKVGVEALHSMSKSPEGLPKRLILCGRLVSVQQLVLTVADAFGEVSGSFKGETEAVQVLCVGGFVELELASFSDHGEASFSRLIAYYPPNNDPHSSHEVSHFQGALAVHLRARQKALKAIRAFFEREEFLELHTPTFSTCPGLDAHVHSLGEVKRLDGAQGYLMTSPEFHMKRALVGGLPKIFQVARVFRAEELGPIHEPEFTLVEWYRAFSGSAEVMADTENLVRTVFAALGSVPAELKAKFKSWTIKDLFAEFAGVDDAISLAENSEDQYFQKWVDCIEPALSELPYPFFITEHPACFGGLARPLEDTRVLDRFELMYRGVELCNGFGELTCPVEQRSRFEAEQHRRRKNAEPVYPLPEAFLASLSEGMPPSGGNALGLERLVMLALGESRISTAIAFPDHVR